MVGYIQHICFICVLTIFMAKNSTPRYVTPYKYAQLCGVSDSAIYSRINRGVLGVIEKEDEMDGTIKRYIDTEKYPPSKLNDYPSEITKKSEKNKLYFFILNVGYTEH